MAEGAAELTATVAALAATVEALAARVHVLEDQLALYQVVARYGPAVDSGDADAASALWLEDGTYETEQTGPMVGRAGIAAMVEGPGHQGLIQGGCGHVLSMPVVEVDGDRAVLTNHSRLYRRTDAGFDLWLLKANRWELERTARGWQVRSRVNRTLDGSPGARALLAQGLGGPPA